VTRVEPSHHERERAYVSLSGYRDDDIAAYVFVTEDLGKTWRSLAAGLPAEAVNVIREDPVNPDVLYVGTDRGAYVSLDRGATWQGLPAGLPNVPVHDLVVHPRDRELVAGTHGRSIYVLDALPIQELTAEVREQPVHVFPVEEVRYDRSWRGRRHPWLHRAEDDPFVKVPFWSKDAGKATLTVLDEGDRPLRRLEMDTVAGVNTFTWNLLLDDELAVTAESQAAESDEENTADKGRLASTPWSEAVRLDRPLYVTPGTYSLSVTTAGGESEVEWTVEAPEPRDPRAKKEPPIRGRKEK
jgi:hypothetical protein